MPKLSDKAKHNVHKLVFLAGEYPNLKMRELSQNFGLSALEINATVFRAKDAGYLYVDDITGFYKVEKKPAKWEFGPAVEELRETLLYLITKLNGLEKDIEDNELGGWGMGLVPQDFMVAMKSLLQEGAIASYELTTLNTTQPSKKGLRRGKQPKVLESTYTFYTLPKNVDKQFGRKQFKDQTKLK